MDELLMELPELFMMESHIAVPLLRATILYMGILVIMRLLPRRTGGELAMMDLIFVLLITEGASHALGEYTSLTEGFIVIATLLAWNYLVNFLSYHFSFFEKLVSAPPLQIIKNGKLISRNMRIEYLTKEELLEQLRKQGIDDISTIKKAFIEGDGKISVVQQ